MSEEHHISEEDLKNHAKGIGIPAPSHVREKIMDTVRDLEVERKSKEKSMEQDTPDDPFNRKAQRKRSDDELER